MQDDTPLPAWCTRLIGELNANDERAAAIARPLSLAQLNWRRQPHEWSVGQCLDHLRVANEVYLPPIEAALAGRPRRVVGEITPGWFGQWFIRSYIDPSPVSKRAAAPRKIVPKSDVAADILEQFLRSNAQARDVVRRARDVDVNRVRFKNPLVPIIYFTVGTGLEIVSRHQRRHLLQAERIAGYLA